MRTHSGWLFCVVLSLALCGCGGGSTNSSSSAPSSPPTPPTSPNTPNQWTWVAGSSSKDASGVYGTLGTPSSSNVPSARDSAVSWTDHSGNLWLFGGEGVPAPDLNDLWEFNPTTKEWTWVSGSSTVSAGTAGQPGIYGTLGTPSASNVPGGRDGSVSWIDGSGNLWLFGGFGIASTVSSGNLNDLWEFNPSTKTWTWVSGSNTANAAGVYGTQGIPSTGNVPGARSFAVSWTDSSDNFWLFGGGDETTAFNDLWEFNPGTKTWTWVSGSSSGNASGVYGTLGVGSASNAPGARDSSSGWTDANGNLWLFGGAGLDSGGKESLLNDLWEFSPTTSTWTWVSGSNTGNAAGTYGTLGTSSSGNTPGARNGSVSWTDTTGNLWLFGGVGFDSTGAGGGLQTSLNDLWKFSPSSRAWTWFSGSNLINATGMYGTLGTASANNVPGSRYSAVSWTDGSGNLWLFGGQTGSGDLNDLWQYQP